jgi:hypothetical protein
MRPLRWIRRQLDRSIAGHEHSTATVCGLLLLIAAAGLILTTPSHPSVQAREHTPSKPTQASSAPSARWTPGNATDTKAVAEAFLGSYLVVLYGQGPASQVKDATAAFVRSLQQGPRRVPPGIRGLHPRIVSLQITPQESSGAVALALVSDGEVVRYPVRVVLTDSGGRWLVSSVESTP